MIAVDVGGTFTDVVAQRDGAVGATGRTIETAKVSTDYGDVASAVLEGAALLGVRDATLFNHASTHGLNAVITRRLPKIGFLTTEGHRDILDMGRVWRPTEAILDPRWRRSFGDAARPLVPRYLRRGVRERITADGAVLFGFDEEQARTELGVLRRCDVAGVAICLINAFVNPEHEQRLRELVREILGDVPCSISSDVSPLAKEYARASTTVIDTLMKLIYSDYTARLEKGLADLGFTGRLNFADCAATLVPSSRAMEQPFRIVFSGPAAGTMASARFGSLIGEDHLLCADVGGTSCDISIVNSGEPFVNTSFELEHDLVVNALANDVTAIGAGGGSVVSIGRDGEVTVGPGSAGSDPGPACYGRGGTEPTTTDTCLMVGIIDPGAFAGGRVALEPELARQAFEGLDSELSLSQRVRHAFEMAVHTIAEGIVNVAIKDGVDPRDYSLIAYGAAGPMLLPSAMAAVHCKEVVVPPDPGLFSALGLLSTDQVFTVQRSAYRILAPEVAPQIDALFAEMEQRVRERLDPGAAVRLERSYDGHLVGQSWDTPFVAVPDGRIDADAVTAMIASFHDTYEERSRNRFDTVPVEAVTFRVRAVIDTPKVDYPQLPQRGDDEELVAARVTTLRHLDGLDDEGREASVFDRAALRAGDEIDGPVVVDEGLSTTYVAPGQRVTVGSHGELRIRAVAS